MDDKPRLRVEYIPLNFIGSGRVFNGMFKQVNLIEAIIMALPGVLVAWYLIEWKELTHQIYGMVVMGGLPFMIGVNGINDEDVFTYLYNFFVFKKTKRTALYNPRAKAETNPDYIAGGDELPREKLERFIAKIRNDADSRAGDLSKAVYDSSQKIYFEDDVDVAGQYGAPDLPDELKSKRQLRREKNARKKMEKQAAKEEKRQLKELKKLQKRQKKAERKRGK